MLKEKQEVDKIVKLGPNDRVKHCGALLEHILKAAHKL
jgi:hypothetical protein